MVRAGVRHHQVRLWRAVFSSEGCSCPRTKKKVMGAILGKEHFA